MDWGQSPTDATEAFDTRIDLCSSSWLFALGGTGDGTLVHQRAPGSRIHLLVDLATPGAMLDLVTADGRGVHAHALPIPANAIDAGLRAYAQFAWFDNCAPQGLSSSRGLDVTVRPQ